MGPKKGKCIVIEGVDGVARSILARQLFNIFNGIEERAVLWSFPRRNSPTGRIIDDHLRGNLPRLNPFELHFLFVRNREEALSEIESLLDAGKIIICNRFWLSGAAYSIARGLGDAEWCIANEPEEVKRLPDVTVLLEGTEEVTECFTKNVAENYKKLFDSIKCPGVYVKLKLKNNDIDRGVFFINK